MPASSRHSSLHFDLRENHRQTSFTAFSDFAQTSQGAPQSVGSTEPPFSPVSQFGALNVKTPTGSRALRRPGLAGASALMNGQYCCQWSVNGVTCRHKFLDAKQLTDHIRSHHVRGAGSFVCQWHGCDKGSFPTANKLVRHVHSHTGYKPFPCPSCPQAFVTKDQLDKHLTTHTGAKDFVCTWPGCGRSFAVKHALDGHMNSVHLKAKKHTCPHCAQAFDDSSNLSKHKKQVHNPDTGIKCPARHTHGCTYVDSRKDKMREHCERMHHGMETVSDPHAWNMWVQQFKTHCKKACSRRHHLLSSSTPSSPYGSMPHQAPAIECSKENCNLPVCLPCNILCNDVHSAHGSVQPCDEPDCDTSCDTGGSCDPCDPCDPCDDPECDLVADPPCIIQPCTMTHCRSPTSTPSRPATPCGVPPESYFQYHPISAAESELFHDNSHPFQISSARLSDNWFVTG